MVSTEVILLSRFGKEAWRRKRPTHAWRIPGPGALRAEQRPRHWDGALLARLSTMPRTVRDALGVSETRQTNVSENPARTLSYAMNEAQVGATLSRP